ncbi:MAG: ribonuclease P protein component [Gammaproteobacteria bacterium]
MAANSFPKSSRLLESADFKAVFDGASFKVSSRHLLILGRLNEKGKARLGMVIAKKNIATAVNRNRIKRQLRDFFRRLPDDIPPLDLVVLARKDAATLSNPEIREALQNLWQDLLRKCLP